MSKKCKEIIAQCLKQNLHFRRWDELKKYGQFHSSHYDWWAFPINQPSSHGDKYQVNAPYILAFLQNKQFIQALRNNSILVCRAWGYDLEKGRAISGELTSDQKWQGWPIRLYKMTLSLQLFKQPDLHHNAVNYGLMLIDRGCKFHYMRDLSGYFNQFREEKENGRQQEHKSAKKEEGKIQKKENGHFNNPGNKGQNKYSFSSIKQKTPTQNNFNNGRIINRGVSIFKKSKI